MDRSSFDVCAKELSTLGGAAYSLASEDRSAAERWGPIAANMDSNEQTRWLSRTIETEIIPRLMLAHRSRHAEQESLAAEPIALVQEHIEQLAQLVLAADADVSLTYVHSLRAAGAPLDLIYLDLLAPAARHLGAMWDEDLCQFADVTLGLWRLQRIMHELGPAFQDAGLAPVQSHRAILVPVPGSQHTLGLFMVSEFFRGAGWEVWGDAMVSQPDIVAAVRKEWFDVIGFSVGAETQIDTLASVILEVRKVSKNRKLVVIIGGPIVALTPGLVAQVGADAMGADAPHAVLQAENLLAARAVCS